VGGSQASHNWLPPAFGATNPPHPVFLLPMSTTEFGSETKSAEHFAYRGVPSHKGSRRHFEGMSIIIELTDISSVDGP